MFLRELFEEPQKKVAVAAFGRMNPPTIGHEKLVEKVKSFEGDHYIFLSQTVNPKDNPLPFDVKLEFAKKFFPGVNVGHPSVRTPIQMLQMLEKLGYTDIIYVAGSDRVASFDKLFNDYNGKEYNFNSITVENAGERDPDAEGAEGMSASKMREAAREGNLEAFAQGVPKPELAQKMYDAVRKNLRGVKDKEPAEGVAKGSSTTWEVSYDYGPHMTKTVTVKAGSEEEASAKVEKAAEKKGMSIMINSVEPKEQGVAEGSYDELDEGSPVAELKKIVASKVYKKEYLMALKMMKQEAISAADAARRFMHVDARTLDAMADKMDI